jgi:tRNA(Ile)-lysidine synthase
MGPHPDVAAIRSCVRAVMRRLMPGDLVLVACSGGADSLALASGVAFEAPRLGLLAGGVTVDHGLQDGSAEQAASAAEQLTRLGLEPVLICAAKVAQRAHDQSGYPGPEAAARAARYGALDRAAESSGAAAVLLGHTLDDQAETVLLGLARGAGARSLAGMTEVSGRYLRPLLGITRAQTRQACAAQGLNPWQDPQNSDPAFSRTRVRHDLLPALEAALGPGIPAALARTARLLRADADLLDHLAAQAAGQLADGGQGLAVAGLAALPAALRGRVIRTAAIDAGCQPGSLTERHVSELDALVTGWHGQRWADLPGGLRGVRRYGRLLFIPASRSEDEGESA